MKISEALWALAPVEFGELVHPEYRRRFPEWQMMRDMVEGQTALHERGDVYLPRRSHMNSVDYDFYLSQASYFNALARTKQDLMTRVFRRPATLMCPTQLVPDKLAKDGRGFRRLFRDITDEVLTVNRIGLLLDIPDEEKVNPDPFLVEYKSEDILNYDEGTEGPTMVLLSETIPKANRKSLFSAEMDKRCRLLALDEDGYYFQLTGTPESFSKMKVYPLIGRKYVEIRGRRLKYIPFFVFSRKGDTLKPEKPLMLDIGHTNIFHYRASARLNMARHYVASPIYVAKYKDGPTNGGTTSDENGEEDGLVIASEFIWEMGADDDADILQMDGNGLETLENALSEYEDQMKALGARLTGQSSRTAARSTSSDEDDKDSNEATLLDVVDAISRTGESLLRTVAEWRGLPKAEILFQLNRQFFARRLGARDLRAIDQAMGRSMPPSAIYAILSEGGWLEPDMTEDQFIDEINEYRSLTNDKTTDVTKEGPINVTPAKPKAKATKALPNDQSSTQ